MKKTIAIIATLAAMCFAQEIPSPEKLAVYVSGANDIGVNKSLSHKLLATLTHNVGYVEIMDNGLFQEELAKNNKGGIAQTVQTAKKHGADIVCVVIITEVLGSHSISARMLKTSDSQLIKTGSMDHTLKTLDDLTEVSGELARQLLPASVVIPPVAAAAVAVDSSVADTVASKPGLPVAFSLAPLPPVVDRVAAAKAALAEAQKNCARTYNINELLYKLKNGFPTQLKDCASKLAKDMLTPAMLGGKKLGEPIAFIKQCSMDGIKKEIPEGFPDADKIVGSVDNFVQTIMNAASGAGGLDPKKLISSVGSISTSINTLLDDVKKISSNKCVVNEPYEPPDDEVGDYDEDDDDHSDYKKNKSKNSFGFRAGFNFSHIYAEYNHSRGGSYKSIAGIQLGMVYDIAAGEVFHIQPGLIYIQRGMEDRGKNDNYGYYASYYNNYSSGDGEITAHYLQFPVLLSLKFSAFRLNAGPYVAGNISTSNDNVFSSDFGISTGLGFDIGWFCIGTFYDYGLTDMSNIKDSYFYNRTLGFNVGINL